MDQDPKFISEMSSWLGILPDQLKELRLRLNQLRIDPDGFGSIKIDIKNHKTYRISMTVEGRPLIPKK